MTKFAESTIEEALLTVGAIHELPQPCLARELTVACKAGFVLLMVYWRSKGQAIKAHPVKAGVAKP